jgi:exonuclease SbcC
MIPLRLSFSNFMSYKEPQDLDFRKISAACISGANGVGKSSILESLTWVLWGKTRSLSDDNLIYQGAQNMWVELEFEVEGIIYKVARKRTLKGRGASELNFFKKGENDLKNLTEDSIKNTQNKITKTLKMPYEIFVNSAYLRQGQADEFTKKTPTMRKEILSEILGLDRYQNLSEAAKDKVRLNEAEIEILQMQVEELAVEIEAKDEIKKELNRLAKIFENKKKELQEKIKIFKEKDKIRKSYEKFSLERTSIKEKYQDKGEQFNQIVLENKEILDELEELKTIKEKGAKINQDFEKYQKINQKIDCLDENFKKLTTLKEERIEISWQIEAEKHKAEILEKEISAKDESKIETLNQRIKTLETAKTCPTCEQKISASLSKKVIVELQKEIENIKKGETKIKIPSLAKLNQEVKSIDREIKKIHYSKEDYQKLEKDLEEFEGIEEQKEMLATSEARFSEKEKLSKSNRDKITMFKKQLKELENQGKKIAVQIKKIEPQISDLNILEQELETKREELFSFQEELSDVKSRYQQVLATEKNLKTKKTKLKKAQSNILIYQDLTLAFGKKGIQAMIISSAIPEIQDTANKILSKMTDGKMKILFETKRQKKIDKEIVETLNIKIIDILGARSYEMFSGGEAFRIDFAIRIALSKLLAKRAGAKLRFLAIDEGFGSQDSEGRTHLVEAIKSVGNDFEKILIITHIQELKDVFNERIDVEKDANGSHINLII